MAISICWKLELFIPIVEIDVHICFMVEFNASVYVKLLDNPRFFLELTVLFKLIIVIASVHTP